MLYEIEFNNYIHKMKLEEIFKMIYINPKIDYYKIINNEKIKINNDFLTKTKMICHRINTIDELKTIPEIFGTEIDLRDNKNDIFLSHEPFFDTNNVDKFEEYLKNYYHNTIILNIKSERIEKKCIELMNNYNITNYFFLDSSFPMIYLINKNDKINNFASRYSQFESFETTKNIKNMINWIWIDCFTELPLNNEIYNEIKKLNLKICIVSPDLQGQEEKIEKYRNYLIENNLIPDAICCKIYNIIRWI